MNGNRSSVIAALAKVCLVASVWLPLPQSVLHAAPSPRTPSKARVLFDDITFQPIGEADLAGLRLPAALRTPLSVAALSVKDGTFQTATDLGLASASMLVAFDKETAALTHLVHRASGQEFVCNEPARPLFRITLTKPRAGEHTETTAAEFGKVAIAKVAAGKLDLTFSDHASLPLTARVTAATDAKGFVRLRIVVGNKSDWAVSSIRFPQFAAAAKLGKEAADDRLLLPLPLTDGAVIEAPGTRTQSRESLYPGNACVQFAAFYDQAAGLYVAAEDPNGHCKRWDLRTVKDKSVEFPLAHLTPEVIGADVTLPYDVVLGAFAGDWRDAAEIYKRWAKRQPWCARTLAARDDIPQFLKDGAGVIVGGIQNAKGYNGFLGDNLERLPQLMADYRQRTELAHMIFVPYGWECRGTWAGINYLPATPSNEAWQKANVLLRAQGDRAAMLTSGFWWVVKRQQTKDGPAFDDTADFQQRKEMVVQNADGTAWTFDNYDRQNRNALWRGLSVKLCHGSAAARETLLRTFLDVARLGTPLVSFDQEIGGGQSMPCYSETHGHPPGYGPWMWTDFRDLCGEILRQGKPIQPELGLLLENCNELTIPYSATYWSRQFGEVDHGLVGARGVGLFSYLYHEYVTAIGAACVQGQGAHGTRPSAELRCYVLGNNLTRGLIPGPFIQDVPLQPTDDWHRMVSAAYFAFCRPYARFPEYLLRGSTCRPPTIACEQQEVWFYRQGARAQSLKPGGPKLDPKLDQATIRLPVVTAGSFAAEDGSIGTVIVNMTAQPREAKVKLSAGGRSAVLYRADRVEQRHWQSSPAEIGLSLEPFGVRMLVLR